MMQFPPCCFPPASPKDKRQGRLSAACQKLFRYKEKLERAKGLEPSTPTLARLCSILQSVGITHVPEAAGRPASSSISLTVNGASQDRRAGPVGLSERFESENPDRL